MNLSVKIGNLELKNPVMGASGTFGFGREYEDFLDVNEIGAIVTKGVTPKPRDGNPGVRIAETPSGMLNCIGLENPGVDAFIYDILPKIKKYNTAVIVNISAGSVEEYAEMAWRLDIDGVDAVEVNISCPNVTDIVQMAKAVEEAGADAISMINTLTGMAIDINTRKPLLGNITGGLSGPAVKPVALRMVWQVAKAVNIPIIGMGGIASAEDAIEFLLAGATAVAVGAHNFIDPSALKVIADGIAEYMQKHNIEDVNELVGALQA